MDLSPGDQRLPLPYLALILGWFFGWGFVMLKFPGRLSRLLAFGKEPTPRQVKRVRMIGYAALFFGCVLAIEVIAGVLRFG